MDTDAQLAQFFAGMWPHLDEHARPWWPPAKPWR